MTVLPIPAAVFDAKHGESIIVGAWKLYEDGAQRELSAFGAWVEPDADPYRRAQAIVRYHEVIVERATDAFTERKAFLKGLTESTFRDGYPPPSDDDIAQLKNARNRVRVCQRRLTLARQHLLAVTPEPLKRDVELMASNRERNQKALEAIKSIQL